MKISILDQTQRLQDISAEDSFAQTVELAQWADKIGIHRYWLSEHHSSDALAGSAPEILASHLLAKTDRIKIGSGGVMLPHYSSYKVAEMFKVMSALAPGRVDLGVGRAPGGHQLSNQLLQGERSRYSNIDQFPQQIDDVLAFLEDKLSENSPYTGLVTSPVVQKKPDLWVLGSSNSSAYLAAEKGLPYNFAQFINYQPDGMGEALRIYLRNFKPSQYLTKPHVMAALKIIVAETDEEAQRVAQSALAFNFNLHRGRILRLSPAETAISHLKSPKDLNELAYIRGTYIIGSKTTVANNLKELIADYPIDELMTISPIYDLENRKTSLKLLKEAVDSI